MPEGHTIHRVARDHYRLFRGEALQVSSPQGRFQAESAALAGQEITKIQAFGKHLVYHWSGGPLLHVHLGLYGKFRVHRGGAPEPRGQIRLRVEAANAAFDLHGPNRCELLTDDELHSLTARLGPDPLRKDADPELAWRRISRSRASIGALLLNQAVIAGVGNVYRAEILHLARISPHRLGRDLSAAEFDKVWSLCARLLELGVKYNRIVVADPLEIGKPRSRMSRSERLLIYKKSDCRTCGAPVRKEVVGGRAIYHCAQCQL